MSLTSELKNPSSSLSRFMDKQFPNTGTFVQEVGRELAGVNTLRPTANLPYSTIGMALDYRIRYCFAITPHQNLVAYSGARKWAGELITNKGMLEEVTVDLMGNSDQERIAFSTKILADGASATSWWSLPAGAHPVSPGLIDNFFASLDDTLRELGPTGRRLEHAQEELLARYCVVLALFEAMSRAGPNINSPLYQREYYTIPDLLALPETHWIEDLCAMTWLFQDRFSELLSHPVVLNPTFDGSVDVGGADADLILDNCLIDIKATVNPHRNQTFWLYQLLGYTLLDYDDHYQLREVGIYLARQGTLLKWPLEELVYSLAGRKPLPITDLRESFQRALGSTRELESREYLTVPEAAKYLGAKHHFVHNDNLTQLARTKKIQAFKVGSRWRVKKEDIDQHWKITT